jgi:16S rRNA (uracil1498-N3)-methyltransferase
VKNAKNEFIVQKATEMGVSAIQPVITKHTIKDKTNAERLNLVAIEAAEQCERLDVPQVFEIADLDRILPKYSNHTIILCDETGAGKSAKDVLPSIVIPAQAGIQLKLAILIGPEGGFSDDEIKYLHAMKNVHAIGLGPRILRAETAIITALALCQNYLGDFDISPEFRG